MKSTLLLLQNTKFGKFQTLPQPEFLALTLILKVDLYCKKLHKGIFSLLKKLLMLCNITRHPYKKKLQRLGINGLALNWFKTYFNNKGKFLKIQSHEHRCPSRNYLGLYLSLRPYQ